MLWFSDLPIILQLSQFKLMNLTGPYLNKIHHVQELLWALRKETIADVKGSSWRITDNWLIMLNNIKDRKQ